MWCVCVCVQGALMANFLSQGEVCSNGTRIYVQEGLYAPFLARLVQQVRAMRVGDPWLEETTVGATIRNSDVKCFFSPRNPSSKINLLCGSGSGLRGPQGEKDIEELSLKSGSLK